MERFGAVSKAKQSRITNCFFFSRKIYYLDATELFNLVFWTTLCFLEPLNFGFVACIVWSMFTFCWLGAGNYAFPIPVPW